MKRFYIYILVVVLFCGCFADEEFGTEIVLRPTVQLESGGDFVEYADCVVYAFDADTTAWELLSWEDARDGVLSSKIDATAKLLPFAQAQSYLEEGLDDIRLSMWVESSSVMIVTANSVSENYGYTIYSVGLNLSKTYIDAPRFRTWKSGEYTEGNWLYYAPESEE